MPRVPFLLLLAASLASATQVLLPGDSDYYYEGTSMTVRLSDNALIPARSDVLLVDTLGAYEAFVGAVYADGNSVLVTFDANHPPGNQYRIKIALGDFVALSKPFGLVKAPFTLFARKWKGKPRVLVQVTNTLYPSTPPTPAHPDDALKFVGYDALGNPTQEVTVAKLIAWKSMQFQPVVVKFKKSRRFKVYFLPAQLSDSTILVDTLIAPPETKGDDWPEWTTSDGEISVHD